MRKIWNATTIRILITVILALAITGGAMAQNGTFVRETPGTRAIAERMAGRFSQIRPLLDAGTVGFGSDGMLVVRVDPEGLAEARRVRALVDQDNQDRRAVVAELARANKKPEWAGQVQASFAQQWIERARPGWHYQDASGNWARK